MARPKKVVLTPEEELEKLTADIESAKENLKELEKQKKELEVQIKMDRLAAIDDLISASGKSLEEVKALLSSNWKEIEFKKRGINYFLSFLISEAIYWK